jgi:hypothetical protein
VSNHARWSPPIPSGAAALTAWRELDRRTRRDLFRGTGPHPDPMVACVAVGYARTMLGGRSRYLLRSLLFAGGTLLLALGSTAVALGTDRPELAPVLPVLVIMPFVVLFAIGRVRLRLRLIRMENANTPALLASEMFPPAPEPPPATGEPVKVAYDRRAVLGPYARSVLISAGASVGMFFLWGRFALLVVALFALMWVLLGYHLVRWVLPGRPVFVLDGAGVTVRDTLRAPWSAITEIRVLPLRGTNRPSPANRVVVFVCADPQAPFAHLTGFRRNNARRTLKYYGSSLAVAGRGLDHSVEQIVAAATAFRPIPVRYFAP